MSATDAKIDTKPEAVEEPKAVEESKPVETVEKKAEETKEEAKPVVAVRPSPSRTLHFFYIAIL